jgi:hypothetical protein
VCNPSNPRFSATNSLVLLMPVGPTSRRTAAHCVWNQILLPSSFSPGMRLSSSVWPLAHEKQNYVSNSPRSWVSFRLTPHRPLRITTPVLSRCLHTGTSRVGPSMFIFAGASSATTSTLTLFASFRPHQDQDCYRRRKSAG